MDADEMDRDDGGLGNIASKIADKAMDALFSNDFRTIFSMTNLPNEDYRAANLGLALVHKLIVEEYCIDDDYIDRNEEILKLILVSALPLKGEARNKITEMLQTQNRILTLGELEKEKGVIR